MILHVCVKFRGTQRRKIRRRRCLEGKLLCGRHGYHGNVRNSLIHNILQHLCFLIPSEPSILMNYFHHKWLTVFHQTDFLILSQGFFFSVLFLSYRGCREKKHYRELWCNFGTKFSFVENSRGELESMDRTESQKRTRRKMLMQAAPDESILSLKWFNPSESCCVCVLLCVTWNKSQVCLSEAGRRPGDGQTDQSDFLNEAETKHIMFV